MHNKTRSSAHEAPWLTVVLPVHNGERWLEETLSSLVEQDTQGFECILLDSSDGPDCLQIAESYQGRLDLRIHSRRDMLPWTVKTNHAVSLASAPFVAMLHQDDLWLPGRASAAHAWLQRRPMVDVHLSSTVFIDNRKRRLGVWRCPLPPGLVQTEILFKRLLVQNFIAIPSPVIRRETFLKVGGLDPKLWYTADWDLYLKLAPIARFEYHPESLTLFRIHAESQTIKGGRNLMDFENQLKQVLDRHLPASTARPEARVRQIAEASLLTNVALMAASRGERRHLFNALIHFLQLGPVDGYRFLRDSRLLERLLPRLRARLYSVE